MELKGRKTVVMGLGEKSGPAAVKFLVEKGAVVTVSEQAPEAAVRERLRELPPQVKYECGGHTAEVLRLAELVVLSPGVPTHIPVLAEPRRRGVEMIGEAELAYRFLSGRMIGVTGTKGKSTTCSLVHHILRQGGQDTLLGGNIGLPLIELVAAAGRDTIVVAELSSFQLATINDFRPWIALVLNFSPDHLDRYADEGEYLDDKLRLIENQQQEDHLVLYRGLGERRQFERSAAGQRYYFDLQEDDFQGCFPRGEELVFSCAGQETVLARRCEVKLAGRHNLLNVLAALTVAGIIDVAPAAVSAALKSFDPLPHRLEFVGEVRGVRYYDDSQGTNPAAMRAALETLAGPLVLIAGGRYKGGDFAELRGLLAEKVKAALLIGEAAKDIAVAWQGATEIEQHGGLETAVIRAAELAAGEGCVLLSPGCSSLDMFSNYRQRSELFRREIRGLEVEK